VEKRLYRSRVNRTIAGVCGGLGEYFAVDPVFIRIAAVLLIFADGIGLLGYLIAWLVIPKRPLETAAETQSVDYASWNKYIPGAVLIIVGLIVIAHQHYWWWHLERFWPLLFIAFGLLLIFRAGVRHQKENSHEPSQI
jgi:phage shock protein C